MKKFTSVLLVVLLAATSAFMAVGCGGNTNTAATTNDGGSAEAPINGEITVYTALEDEVASEYLESFNKQYPEIKVSIVRDSTGIITARLLAEKDNPVADVVWGTAASSLLVLEEEGMLEPYAPQGVESILPQFKSDKVVPTWVGIDAWETVFVVNTVEIEKLGLKASDIKSYKDLLRPELKGHVVMPNPASSGTGLLTVTGLLQLNDRDSEKGWDYMNSLHENIKHYTHSGSKPARMAASGECVVGVSFGFTAISQKSQGAPVEVIFPAEGSGWDLEANALMKKAEINPAAQAFLDWAITDEVMNLYAQNYPIITNGNVSTYDGFPSFDPVEQLIENDLVWIAANREDILNRWTELFDGKSEAK